MGGAAGRQGSSGQASWGQGISIVIARRTPVGNGNWPAWLALNPQKCAAKQALSAGGAPTCGMWKTTGPLCSVFASAMAGPEPA